MMRLDSANVDSIDDMFIEHTRDSSIDMNLANGVWSLGSISSGCGPHNNGFWRGHFCESLLAFSLADVVSSQ